ncbi:MAG: oligosaccharide flippase family protein, partial [Clostridia bacterium]|nr:oligosaccharide flippase family protein [Clostridia bacterium]
MNRYKKLLSNTAVFAAGQFLSKAMVYLLMPLYTAVLTKEQSSAADMIQQVGNFLMPVAALGLCEGILRFAMDSGVDGTDPVALKKKVFSSSMTVMFLSTLLFAALAPLALLFGFDAGYIWLTVGFVVAANLQMAVSYYVRSLGHTTVYAVQGIINTALTIAFNVIFLVWLRWGVTGFILAITLANLLVSFILIIWMKLWRDFEPGSVDRKTVKALLLYSLPLIPTTVM